MRNALLIAVVLPLWANYLVRVFAWRIILTPNGFLNSVATRIGLGSLQLGRSNWAIWLTSVYLWLPFTLLPIYAALERVPASFLEASEDLGARGWFTFRRVVFPLILPGIVAGSFFSFSLTLGDYIVPELVGNTQFIGNVIYDNVGVAGNIPLAAAFALVPIADHGRLPDARETSRRVRGALPMESAGRADPDQGRDCVRARRSCTCPSRSWRSTPSTTASARRGRSRTTRRSGSASRSGTATVRQALINSLQVALFATALALILGSAAAFAVHRFDFFGRTRCRSCWCSPSRSRGS